MDECTTVRWIYCSKCKQHISYIEQDPIDNRPYIYNDLGILCKMCFKFLPKMKFCNLCKNLFPSNGSFKRHLYENCHSS
jgi:hypothetical protein